MSQAQLLPVQFHSDTIFCVNVNDQPFAPVKPIVENMGLAWQTQQRKLQDNKARWGVTILVIPSESGDQRTICMPVRKLPAFFASINPKKVRPELRDKIEIYQQECDDALWAYWTEGQAVRKPFVDSDSLTPEQQAQLQAIVQAKVGMLPREVQRKAYKEVWPRFNNHFQIARYAQLPPAKMGEAVEYLVSMEVKAAKALPPSNAALAAAAMSHFSLPPSEMSENDIVDDARGKRLKRVLRDLHAMQEQCGGLIDEVRICLSPKGRMSFLPEKLDNTYKTLQHLNFAATAGVYMARQALISAYHIGKGIEFCQA